MGVINLKNITGKRSGTYVRYEFGEDLFGYYYIDIVRGKKNIPKTIKSVVFENSLEFIFTLDKELGKRDSLNYTR